MVVHEGAWAGAISVFALLAVVGVALGFRHHGVLAPLVIATVGGAIILWVMFGSSERILELMGFAALIAATIWDWRLKRLKPQTEPQQTIGSGAPIVEGRAEK